MSETLILKSINGNQLTEKLINSWFDINEIFITKKSFSDDRCSIEITFLDEERAEMISDLLTTCYSNYISIERPRSLIESLNNSFDDERVASPLHLSSAASISSRVSCFSQRLSTLDTRKNNEHVGLGIGRGYRMDINPFVMDLSKTKEIKDDKKNSIMITYNATSSTTSITDKNISLGFGRGRGSIFQ
ncbi:unnamed protein product [Rotaria magnacalcarata]